jgi:hypothetical protein
MASYTFSIPLGNPIKTLQDAAVIIDHALALSLNITGLSFSNAKREFTLTTSVPFDAVQLAHLQSFTDLKVV